MSWHVFIDFDGTVSRQDSTDVLLERFADPAWKAIEARWQAGLIGSRQCMAQQVALLRLSETALQNFIGEIDIDPAFPAFVAACHALDLAVTVVSDGLDRIVGGVLARSGLADLPVRANALIAAGEQHWQLNSPHLWDGCRSAAGTCKCRVAAKLDGDRRADLKLRLLIGDGSSDQCLAEEADFVVAKSALLAFCRRRNIPHLPFDTFGDVLALPALLADWSPATIAAAARTLAHV
jgi:2-hydroxy-3-keto-5-methylthiopentenyl-1-phosphate phosphatase